jgi:putative DNA primase/helicase
MMHEQEQEPMRLPVERVPQELQAYRQWVNWRVVDGRKVPVNPATRGNAGVHWPNSWASFEQARATAIHAHLGVGFVLTDHDPYTVLDLDHCLGEEGQVSEPVQALIDLLAGYVELSPSGTGLHIWVKSEMLINRRRPGLEVYSNARWMTFTGLSHGHGRLDIPERTAAVAELVSVYFPEVARGLGTPSELQDDDVALWQRLFASKHGAFFESLYRGDISVCYNDHSRAVIMLANQLARLTDLDAARMKRLLYQTGLVRQKWEEKRGKSGTWLDYQILDAIRYVARRKR